MPLNKDILGAALYDVRSQFSNRTTEDLIDEYGSLEAARLQASKDEAEVIITHLIGNTVVQTTGTAAAQTGTITA